MRSQQKMMEDYLTLVFADWWVSESGLNNSAGEVFKEVSQNSFMAGFSYVLTNIPEVVEFFERTEKKDIE
jgi:hypothetical protein